MLDTVHAYAHEQLEICGEANEVRGRHHSWATATSPPTGAVVRRRGLAGAFDAVAGDLRAALLLPGRSPPAPMPLTWPSRSAT